MSVSQILVFDRALVRRHRDRAAVDFAKHAALFEEIAVLLDERVGDVARTFEVVLDLGARDGVLAQKLAQRGVRFVVATDISEEMGRLISFPCAVVDEECLPFGPGSFDLIVSNASLHWVNDLPGALAQIHLALRPDGLFLSALLGGETLHELRQCMTDAELAVSGGVSPRVSPVIDLATASGLLQRAGFQLPVVDHEVVTLVYPDAFALMRELRGMGEGNAHLHRVKRATRRAVLMEAARLYQERFTQGRDGVQASFDVLFLHGWKASC
jgi:NADH dehydrogenase [ubiquinone] 1 alpha subcomplex assembly factor 5